MASPTKTMKGPTEHLEARNATIMEPGQTVVAVCQRKALAKAGKKLTTTEGDYGFMSPTSKLLSQPTSQRIPQKRKLPPLPKEDFKIMDTWSGRELNPVADEQGGGDGARGDPNNIPP
ncbi:hypothetical protein MRX96_030193 [Rhipicephalus microplus]